MKCSLNTELNNDIEWQWTRISNRTIRTKIKKKLFVFILIVWNLSVNDDDESKKKVNRNLWCKWFCVRHTMCLRWLFFPVCVFQLNQHLFFLSLNVSISIRLHGRWITTYEREARTISFFSTSSSVSSSFIFNPSKVNERNERKNLQTKSTR